MEENHISLLEIVGMILLLFGKPIYSFSADTPTTSKTFSIAIRIPLRIEDEYTE
jgi:hypothetical protein